MAEGDSKLIYTKLVEYCGQPEKAKGKVIAACMVDACSKMKGKACDKMTVQNVCDTAAAQAFGKGNMFDLTPENCAKFEELFCQKRLERAGKKPSPDDVQAEIKIFRQKLSECHKAGLAGTKTSKTGGVDRMTDASKYTGASKERFDAGSGKGKGIAGREDKAENTGYVGNYKGKDTFDKSH